MAALTLLTLHTEGVGWPALDEFYTLSEAA